MARSKTILFALLVSGAVCLSYAIPDPTVSMDNAKDQVLQAASTAYSNSRFPAGRTLLQDTADMDDAKDKVLSVASTAYSKSRFPVGRTLLQDTADMDDAKDKVLSVASTAYSKSRFPVGRTLLQDTADMDDAKDKVLSAASTAYSKSRFPTGRSLLAEGKNDVDRAALNQIKINDGTSRVANAAEAIAASVNRRNWATRRMLAEGKNDVDEMQVTAIKVDNAISDVENEFSDIDTRTHLTMTHQGRQLLANKKAELPDMNAAASQVEQKAYDMGFNTKHTVASSGSSRHLLKESEKVAIPDTDVMAGKVAQAVYDMGFDASRKSGSSGRHLLQAVAGDAPKVIPPPKVTYGTTATVSDLTRNTNKISSGSSTVSSLFDKIASRARFGASPGF